MDEHKLAFLSLYFTQGIGNQILKQLISYAGNPSRVFELNKAKLLQIPGIGESTAEIILKKENFKKAEIELSKIQKSEGKIITYIDNQFPSRLKQIPDAPLILYQKGNTNFENTKCVAIVGTRQASDYGKSFVEKLIEQLIPHQPLIISGLAYGIDITAHKASVKHNLQTLGVLGSGIDIIYPAAHKETARKMCDTGGLISEQPFGTKPDAYNFPARNRIIAGLSDLIIVVEAANKGGALITAEIANSYNKEVMAVPGSVFSPQSVGCHQLIKQNKAHLLSDVKDIEYLMNWEPGIDKKEKEIPPDLTENELKVFQQLSNEQKKTMDEISWGSSIPIQQVAGILLNLEFRGLVKSFPGNQFKKIYN